MSESEGEESRAPAPGRDPKDDPNNEEETQDLVILGN